VSLPRVTLSSFPERASVPDYAGAAAELEGLLAELPGAVAVYRFGNVGAPGISDIDRLVVVESADAVQNVWNRLSARTRYLALHSAFLLDPQTFARHRWFSDIGPLDLAWGDPLPFEERPTGQGCEALIAAENLLVELLKLNKLATTRRAKVRSVLCELNTVRFDLELGGIDRLAAPTAWDLVDHVTALRGAWWRLEEEERISGFRRLLDTALPAIHDALAGVGPSYANSTAARKLPLTAEWSRVTLFPGAASPNGSVRTGPILVGRSRRLGEALWRSVPRRVEAPAAVLELIAGESEPVRREFRAERERIVRRYDRILTDAPGYSSLSAARIFLQ
jgi:hypothetical protein